MPVNPLLQMLLRLTVPLILLLLFLLLYSDRLDGLVYHKVYVWAVAAIVLLLIPLLTGLSIRAWLKPAHRTAAMLTGFATLLINGPVYGVWLGRHEAEMYRQHGVRTKALVTRTFYNEGPQMYYRFEAEGLLIESFSVSNPASYAEGDGIDIVYNRRHPEMNSTLESPEK